MNKWLKNLSLAFAIVATLFISVSVRAQDKKNSRGEAFYLIGSVDRARSQILLKRPTEVTILVKVDGKTQIQDETGKTIQIADLASGNTVWVSTSGGDAPVATKIRKGPMTVAELHQIYLDYPEIK